MPFRKVENCNQVVKIGKQLNFSLVNIAGNDIVQGNKKLILGTYVHLGISFTKISNILSELKIIHTWFSAYLWQLMRFSMLQLLKNLRFHSNGKEITDAHILDWANSKVKSSGSQSRMNSFKVLFRNQILALKQILFVIRCACSAQTKRSLL